MGLGLTISDLCDNVVAIRCIYLLTLFSASS